MTNSTEHELARLLLLGDVASFDTLYHQHHHALYFNILKLTKDPESARDILQEVFITLWRRRADLDPDQSVLAWLFVVSYNKSIDYLKKTAEQSAATLRSLTPQPIPGNQDLEWEEARLQLLEEAIQKLSPQKRKVFELCKLQGKTYEETARELHISKNTVKEYLSGAIAYIKLYIQQHPDYYTGCISLPLVALLLCIHP